MTVCHYRLSRLEYERAVEAGAFEPDAKLELIDGDLHAMTPEGSRHSLGIDLTADCLREVFGPGFYIVVARFGHAVTLPRRLNHAATCRRHSPQAALVRRSDPTRDRFDSLRNNAG